TLRARALTDGRGEEETLLEGPDRLVQAAGEPADPADFLAALLALPSGKLRFRGASEFLEGVPVQIGPPSSKKSGEAGKVEFLIRVLERLAADLSTWEVKEALALIALMGGLLAGKGLARALAPHSRRRLLSVAFSLVPVSAPAAVRLLRQTGTGEACADLSQQAALAGLLEELLQKVEVDVLQTGFCSASADAAVTLFRLFPGFATVADSRVEALLNTLQGVCGPIETMGKLELDRADCSVGQRREYLRLAGDLAEAVGRGERAQEFRRADRELGVRYHLARAKPWEAVAACRNSPDTKELCLDLLVRDGLDLLARGRAKSWEMELPKLALDPSFTRAARAARRDRHLQLPRGVLLQVVTDEREVPDAMQALRASAGQAVQIQNCSEAEDQPPLAAVGFDTEWGLSKKDGLCLLQLATRSRVVILDMLALAGSACLCRSLEDLFADGSVTKLAFAAAQDIQQLQRFGALPPGCRPEPLVDLADEASGLSHLTKEVLGLPLDKAMQASRWEKRPLTAAQLRYAAMDAWVLAEIFGRSNRSDSNAPSSHQMAVRSLATENIAEFPDALSPGLPLIVQSAWRLGILSAAAGGDRPSGQDEICHLRAFDGARCWEGVLHRTDLAGPLGNSWEDPLNLRLLFSALCRTPLSPVAGAGAVLTPTPRAEAVWRCSDVLGDGSDAFQSLELSVRFLYQEGPVAAIRAARLESVPAGPGLAKLCAHVRGLQAADEACTQAAAQERASFQGRLESLKRRLEALPGQAEAEERRLLGSLAEVLNAQKRRCRRRWEATKTRTQARVEQGVDFEPPAPATLSLQECLERTDDVKRPPEAVDKDASAVELGASPTFGYDPEPQFLRSAPEEAPAADTGTAGFSIPLTLGMGGR
ncbi:unnamed protein product, partial [Polarella glacialis]